MDRSFGLEQVRLARKADSQHEMLYSPVVQQVEHLSGGRHHTSAKIASTSICTQSIPTPRHLALAGRKSANAVVAGVEPITLPAEVLH